MPDAPHGRKRPGWDWAAVAFGAPAAVVLGAFFFAPMGGMVAVSFAGPTPLAAYEHFFLSRGARSTLVNTVAVAAAVTAVCLLSALAFSLALRALPPLVRRISLLAVVLPLWISSLVRTYAWFYLLSREGVINSALLGAGLASEPFRLLFNWGAVGIGMVHVLLPYMVLPVNNAVAAIDPDLVKAARSLGAGPTRILLTITLPMIGRGMVTGSLIVFVLALGFYITPLMLGGPPNRMLAIYIDTLVNATLNWPNAAAAAVILVVIVAALLAVGAGVARLRFSMGPQ